MSGSSSSWRQVGVLSDPNVALGRLAVALLSGSPCDLERGAALAMRRKLGGLFLYGLSADPITRDDGPMKVRPAVREALRRAASQEVADEAAIGPEMEEVLGLMELRGLCPVVLKGRLLGQTAWPRSAFRPSGDLDLLIEPESFGAAIDVLRSDAYLQIPSEPLARFRPSPYGIMFVPPKGRLLMVDLHSQLFRSVGHRIDAQRLLARSRPTSLLGHPVRTLDEADRLLFLLVHAAKHRVRRTKWLLDLYAVALRTNAPTWERVASRAAASGTRRPVFAAMRLLAGLPGVAIGSKILADLRPPFHIRRVLSSLITINSAVEENSPTKREEYLLESLLEESALGRVRMACGVLERLIRFRG